MAEMTVEQQRALAIARARRRRAEAAPEVSRTEATLSGFGRGLKTATENIQSVDPLSLLMDATGFGAKGRKALDARTAAIAQQAERSRPNYFAGGEIAGELAPALAAGGLGGAALRGVGGALARVAPRAGGVVQRVGTAMQTGGIGAGRTAAQTAAMTRGARAGQLAERVAGGAAAGAAGAALTDQDVTTGAAFGGGLPVMASVLKRVGGAVPDLFKLPTLKAAEVIRKSLGENVDAARAAFEALPADSRELARQTLVKLGIEPRVFMAVAEGAERLRPDEVAGILGEQAAAREARLAAAGGGPTATATRSAAETGRRDVSRATGPMRETALERANIAGREVPQAEQLAAQARARAEQESGLARRMTFGAERAETRLGQADDLGDVFDPTAVARERGLAGAMAQRGEQAALGAIGLRGEAAAAQQQIADLAAQGIRALETQPLVGQIRAMASAEGAGEVQRNALLDVARQIESQGSIIRAGDLDAIRRGVNVTISRLNQGLDVGSVNKAAAGVVGQIKPLIDTSIETAGGRGYGAAKTAFATGASDLERQAFAGDLAGMFEKGPAGQAQFADIVGGARGTTGTVEAAFPRGGRKNFDIQEMMGVPGGAAGPSRMPALQNIASEVKLNQSMATQAAEGENVAKNLLKSPRQEVDIFNKYSPIGMATSGTLALLKFTKILADTGLDTKIQQTLAEGFRSGKSAENLLMTIPAADRAQVARRLVDNGLLSAKSIAGISSFNAMNTPPDQALNDRVSVNNMRR